MLRGAKKNMIVVRTRDSRLFEEAYFVMRRDRRPETADDRDILWEANRILESTIPTAERTRTPAPPVKRQSRLKNLLWFGAGMISGGGIGVLLSLLF